MRLDADGTHPHTKELDDLTFSQRTFWKFVRFGLRVKTEELTEESDEVSSFKAEGETVELVKSDAGACTP